jgi:soluble lytic murein transglycosylase-like protein
MRRSPILLTAAVALIAMATAAYPGGFESDGTGFDGPIDDRALMGAVGGMFRIDPDLLAAIETAESSGRADAVSPRGAIGLMQLMPATAQEFQVQDPYDPIDSALGAARFIDFIRQRQAAALRDGNLADLIAAYNAGEMAVERYGGVPPYDETREYVRRVLWLYLAGMLPPRDEPKSSVSTITHRKAAPRNIARSDANANARARIAELRRERAIAQSAPAGTSFVPR